MAKALHPELTIELVQNSHSHPHQLHLKPQPKPIDINLEKQQGKYRPVKKQEEKEPRREQLVRMDQQLKKLVTSYNILNKVSHRHFDWVAGVRIRGNYLVKVVIVYKTSELRRLALPWFNQELVGYRSTLALLTIRQIVMIMTERSIESITLVDMPIDKEEDKS